MSVATFTLVSVTGATCGLSADAGGKAALSCERGSFLSVKLVASPRSSNSSSSSSLVCTTLLQISHQPAPCALKEPCHLRNHGCVSTSCWVDRRQLGKRQDAKKQRGIIRCSRDFERGLSQNASISVPPDQWDVVGLGQAMVDFSAMVGFEFLGRLRLEKGVRKVVNHEERGKVLRALDGCSFKASAGGSLSNTLVALARLGSAQSGRPALNVAMTGSVGSDLLGDFYRAKLLRANVHFLSPPIVDGTTGTVIVLTPPDAQRTMLSYQGMSSVVEFDAFLARTISMSKVLVVEGYLWEIPQTIEAIGQACEAAHKNGALVALTASDVSCVTRHRKQFWDVMAHCADIFFANSDEARGICGFGNSVSPATAAQHLSQFCPLVSVTDGAQGSYIGLKGEVMYISPAPCVPVDTCGAGDAYAAGILYGMLQGVSDLKGMGHLAARVAAVVVGQQGARLREKDAVELAQTLYASNSEGKKFEVTGICTDI